MRFERKAIAVVGALAVAAAVAAAPAQSTVREQWNVNNQPYSFTIHACGFPMSVNGVFGEAVVIREGKGDDDGAFPVINRFNFRETLTNLDTGEWFTIAARDTFVETRATRVDGPIFEFRFVQAGQPYVVRDSDGNLVARNRGAVHGTYLFDTGGDDEPGGTQVEGSAEIIRVAGPHPSFETTLCEIATDLIG